MEPRTFEIAIRPDGTAASGKGLLAAFVPAADNWPPVVVMACDPRHDPGRPIQELAPPAIGHISLELREAAVGACWTVIDNFGRFTEAVPDFMFIGGTIPPVTFQRFEGGLSIDAFYQEVGPAGEAAIELLSSLIELPSQDPETPSAHAFLDAIEAHGSLPAPGVIFRKVSTAAEDGDARKVAEAIQPDPVISSSLINSANAARFIHAGKTASVPQAVTRLGTSFVRRVVFVAEMMSRYKHGVCSGFDYRAYWHNAVATGASMRALLEEYQIPARMADDAFTTGLVSGIGWLVVAETYPALMARYLERIKDADPVTKARAQREIFPCEMAKVSERYLQRFEFPEVVHAAVAGRTDVDRKWYDALARAIRVAQGISPFACLAIPTTIPVPNECRVEWARWSDMLTILK